MSIIIPSNSIVSGGFNVDNSVRLDGTSAYFNRTPSSAGNQKKFTFSTWIKRSKLTDAHQDIITADAGDLETYIFFKSNTDNLNIYSTDADGNVEVSLITTQVFRDTSAWYHIVVAVDSTQGTDSNRFKVYVNGTQVTSFSTATYPAVNSVFAITDDAAHMIGRRVAGGKFLNGYLAETVLIDGTQNAPTDFGEFDEDSGIWKPINVSGLTFGTTGFYLNYQSSGDLGASTNSNNFTSNSLAATDQSTDTCTNNFCTMNPLNVPASSAPTFSEGNLKSISANSKFGGSSTIGLTSGKWFLEAKSIEDSTIRNTIGISGEVSELARLNASPTASSSTNSSVAYQAEGGNKYVNYSDSSYGATYGNNDIIGIAIDLDSGTKTVTFYKNGASQGAITIPTAIGSTTDGAYFIVHGSSGASPSTFEFNFGSPPYSESGGNSDGDGYGNFSMTVPSGYFAINTKNLAEYG